MPWHRGTSGTTGQRSQKSLKKKVKKERSNILDEAFPENFLAMRPTMGNGGRGKVPIN